ncbi:MAG: hypothetical protein OEZ34_15295 [Spirochaetia bacterium]|nr:hypothetical protein [Spirochaetia bacterium]
MIRLIPILIIALTISACSGPYLKNRARDFADIATFELHTKAYGTSIRLGPIHAGLSYKSPHGKSWGLRSGHVGNHNTAEFTAVIFGSDYFTSRPMTLLLNKGIPSDSKDQSLLPSGTKELELLEEFNPETEDGANIAILRQRGKEYRARSPFGTTVPLQKKKSVFKKKEGFAPGYYFTQIDVSIGLYYGIRVGFNPGELLDFLLGWFKVDLYHDDEPFEDPRVRMIKNSPLWKSLDKKSQNKLLKEIQKY